MQRARLLAGPSNTRAGGPYILHAQEEEDPNPLPEQQAGAASSGRDGKDSQSQPASAKNFREQQLWPRKRAMDRPWFTAAADQDARFPMTDALLIYTKGR
ncbi:hypothetical protein N7488_010100 [Penicillium malachiteum]|nr:hypothetical protein N7488_010100 [Penicillium malachiteum]